MPRTVAQTSDIASLRDIGSGRQLRYKAGFGSPGMLRIAEHHVA